MTREIKHFVDKSVSIILRFLHGSLDDSGWKPPKKEVLLYLERFSLEFSFQKDFL